MVTHPWLGVGGVGIVMYGTYTKREKSQGKIRKCFTVGYGSPLISVMDNKDRMVIAKKHGKKWYFIAAWRSSQYWRKDAKYQIEPECFG